MDQHTIYYFCTFLVTLLYSTNFNDTSPCAREGDVCDVDYVSLVASHHRLTHFLELRVVEIFLVTVTVMHNAFVLLVHLC